MVIVGSSSRLITSAGYVTVTNDLVMMDKMVFPIADNKICILGGDRNDILE